MVGPGRDSDLEQIIAQLNRMDERVDARLLRMETSLTGLIRMEEQTTTLFRELQNVREAQIKLLTRIHELEQITFGRGLFFRWAERISLIIFTAVVTSLAAITSRLGFPLDK